MNKLTPWEAIDQYPPPYVRLLAKRPGSGRADMAMSDAEIAIHADMPASRVREISRLPSWDGVPLGEVRRFFAACQFDPTRSRDRQRVSVYERVCTTRKKEPFNYLRLSPKWESEFLPLIRILPGLLNLPKNSHGLKTSPMECVATDAT